MKKRKKYFFILYVLIFLFITANYPFLDKKFEDFFSDYEFAKVERVIDGDTIIANNERIRLLSINAPEKNELYYNEAKNFLEKEILNKTIKLEFGKIKKDKYNRKLAYVFLDEENINLKIVENGLANFYFPSGKDYYYGEFLDAWNKCISKNINLCESSKNICKKCIELKEFDYENQKIVFYNKCDFNCELTNWSIKDEGRKKFVFNNFVLKPKKEIVISVKENYGKDALLWNEDYVWTKTGDTLFLRDEKGKLVLWSNY